VQYFVPDIRLTAELPPQFNLEEKLGGIPWGLPPDRWPACADCGKPQTLLAQFVHHPMRLDLNREGRCLFVFHCTQNPGMCDSWRGGGGANACFVIEPEDLLSALTPPPAKAATPEREARIVQWQEREDGVTAEQGAFFFDDERWLDLDEAAREELFPKAELSTRLGGVPHWIQSSSEAPGEGWRFVGQLDSIYHFLVAPAPGAEGVHVSGVHKNHPMPNYSCEGPKFGDAGIGYIFVKTDANPPQGWFFWQCG